MPIQKSIFHLLCEAHQEQGEERKKNLTTKIYLDGAKSSRQLLLN